MPHLETIGGTFNGMFIKRSYLNCVAFSCHKSFGVFLSMRIVHISSVIFLLGDEIAEFLLRSVLNFLFHRRFPSGELWVTSCRILIAEFTDRFSKLFGHSF